MATGYEPNIVGAIAVLVDLMRANGFTMTREPYEPNYRGLVDAIIDLKEGFPTFAPSRVGFDATTFEAVSDGGCPLHAYKRWSGWPSSGRWHCR